MRILLFFIIISSFILNVIFLTKDSIIELKQRLAVERKDVEIQMVVGENEKQKLFSVSKETQQRVDFWEKVYSKYDSNQSIFHDSKNLTLIYGVLDFNYLNREKYNKFQREIIRNKLVYKEKEKIKKTIH